MNSIQGVNGAQEMRYINTAQKANECEGGSQVQADKVELSEGSSKRAKSKKKRRGPVCYLVGPPIEDKPKDDPKVEEKRQVLLQKLVRDGVISKETADKAE